MLANVYGWFTEVSKRWTSKQQRRCSIICDTDRLLASGAVRALGDTASASKPTDELLNGLRRLGASRMVFPAMWQLSYPTASIGPRTQGSFRRELMRGPFDG